MLRQAFQHYTIHMGRNRSSQLVCPSRIAEYEGSSDNFGELVNARYSIFTGVRSRYWKNFSQEKRMLFRFAASLNIGLLSLQ